MPNTAWEQGKPPHNKTVVVEFEGKITEAKAIWGDPDEGILPHWEIKGGLLVNSGAIKKWRYKV